MVRMLRIVALACLYLLGTGCQPESVHSLSDSEAVSIIRNAWANQYKYVELGRYRVFDGMAAEGKKSSRDISVNTFKGSFQVLERLGFIHIVKERDVREEVSRGSWKSLSEIATTGTVMEINVQAAPRGLELEKASGIPLQEGKLIIPACTLDDFKVVKNDIHLKGADVYRVVRLTCSMKCSPEYTQFYKLWIDKGRELSNERKAIVLLKHDAFQGQWKLDTWDAANLPDEFHTRNVNSVLAK